MYKVKLNIDGAYILSFTNNMSIEDKQKNCALLSGIVGGLFGSSNIRIIKNKVVIYLTPTTDEITDNYMKIKANLPTSFYMDNFISYN